MTNEEIEKFLSGLKTKSFRSRDEAEVSGYADALDLIYSNYDNIPLSENHIKQHWKQNSSKHSFSHPRRNAQKSKSRSMLTAHEKMQQNRHSQKHPL